MKTITNITLVIWIFLLTSCLSGSKEVLTKDVSGLTKIEFPLHVSKGMGHASQTVSIKIVGVDEQCTMYIENKGTKEHRVSWTKEVGGRHGGDYQLKPGDKKEIYEGVSSRIAFGLYDLSSVTTDMVITIVFEHVIPEDTRMHIQMLWADGP